MPQAGPKKKQIKDPIVSLDPYSQGTAQNCPVLELPFVPEDDVRSMILINSILLPLDPS